MQLLVSSIWLTKHWCAEPTPSAKANTVGPGRQHRTPQPTKTSPYHHPRAWWNEDGEGGSRLPCGNSGHGALLITMLFGRVLFVQAGLLSSPALGRPPWSLYPTQWSVKGCGAIQQQALQDMSRRSTAEPETTFSTAALSQGMGPVLIPPPSPPTLTASSPTRCLLAVGAGRMERMSPRPPGLVLHPCTWASLAHLPEWIRSPRISQGVLLKGTGGLRIALPRGKGNSGVFSPEMTARHLEQLRPGR